jgi:hypothetical protein
LPAQLFSPQAGFAGSRKSIWKKLQKTVLEMQQRIASKLRAAGANSKDKAITAQEADFDDPEQNWLGYIAGGLFALIKKTQDKKYYITTLH